jgi:L-fuconolactonase
MANQPTQWKRRRYVSSGWEIEMNMQKARSETMALAAEDTPHAPIRDGPRLIEPALEPDLQIVDGHHHLWIVPPFPEMQPFPIEQFANERGESGHNVCASVFVDCQRAYLRDGPEHLRVIGETRAVEVEAAAAERAGGIMRGLAAAIVSRADMNLGAKVEKVLLAHMAESPTRFRGIRHMTPWHPGIDYFNVPTAEGMMRSDAFHAGVLSLGKLGLSFDALVLFTQLDDVVHLGRAVPETIIVLNHAGMPLNTGPRASNAGDVFDMWKRGMMNVASCPNVVVKIGGLIRHMANAEPTGAMNSREIAGALRQFVLTTIDLFSPDRCMFESNFPIDRRYASYSSLWNGYKLLTADFTRAERNSMFARTAAKTYRLSPNDER